MKLSVLKNQSAVACPCSVRFDDTYDVIVCGLGTAGSVAAALLAEKGYRVLAADASVEMLTEAMMKSAMMEKPPMFFHQSMEKLRLVEPVDAAISTVDAINYLTREKDVRETFKRVYRWLKPGGQFIFDVNTPYKLCRMDGELYTDETEESYCVWRTFWSEKQKCCTYQVDLFQRTENDTWEREFEEHRERAWAEEELRQFLTEAGFRQIFVTGDMTTRVPREDDDRVIFRAVKI